MNAMFSFRVLLMLLASSTLADAQELPCSFSPATVKPDQKITPLLCSELSKRTDSDYLPVRIYFMRGPVQTDTVDHKKDTTGIEPSPSSGEEPTEYTEYTHKLFSDYDLRSTADSSQRLSAPTTIEGSYFVLTTKKTVLQMNQAQFIMNITYWNPEPAALLFQIQRQRASNPAGESSFDLKGRIIRISSARVPRLLFRR